MTAIMTDAREILAAYAERRAARLERPDVLKWRIDQISAEEYEAARAFLEADASRCGRCGMVQSGPRPDVHAYQMTVHAVDHLRFEDMPAETLVSDCRSRYVRGTRPWLIARCELERRGIDPRTAS